MSDIISLPDATMKPYWDKSLLAEPSQDQFVNGITGEKGKPDPITGEPSNETQIQPQDLQEKTPDQAPVQPNIPASQGDIVSLPDSSVTDAVSLPDENLFTESGHPKFEEKDGHTIPTREAFKEEESKKNIGNTITAIPKGIMGVRDQINKAGQDMFDASHPTTAIIRNKIAENFPSVRGALEGLTGYNLSETPEQIQAKKIKPLSVVEGAAQLPEIAKKVAEGTGEIVQKTLNNPVGLGDESGKDANFEIRYQHHVGDLIEQQRRAKGESILGDVANAMGMDRKILDKNIDQGQAGLWGLMVDPTFLVSGPAKAVRLLAKAGKFAEAEDILKLANEGRVAKAAEGAIPPALEEAAKTAPVAEEVVKPIIDETKPTQINLEKAPEGAIPPVLGEAEKPFPATGSALPQEPSLIQKAVDKTGQVISDINKSPASAAVSALGSTLETTGNIAKKATGRLIETIDKNPLTSGFIIGTGTKLAEGEDVGDALTYGMHSGLFYFLGHGSGLIKKIGNIPENISLTGRVLKGMGESMENPGTRSLAKIANNFPAGSIEQKIFKGAAFGTKTLQNLGETLTPVQRIAANIVKGGTFLGPEIVNPAVRGALIGGGLQGIASGGDPEQAAQGAGAGAVIGPLGHATGKVLENGVYNPKNDQTYVSMRLAEKPEAVRNKIMAAIQSNGMDIQSVAHLLEIDDLLKPMDGTIEYLTAPEFDAEVRKAKPDLAVDASKQRGFLVKAEQNGGKPKVLVNLDASDSSTLPHEIFHVFQGLGQYKDFSHGKNPKPIGEDALAPSRNDFFNEAVGNEKEPGLYSDEDLKRFWDQYHDLLGVNAPQFGPLEKSQLLSELWADGGGQFMERARLNSGNQGVLEYAKRVHSMSEGEVQMMMDRLQRSRTGQSRNLGDSALFKDANGERIRNNAEMEKAIADFVLTKEGVEGKSAPGEGQTNEFKVDESELVNQVDKAVTQRREATYANDVASLDEANKKLIDMAKLRMYKTKPKPPAQVLAEAKERAVRIYGKENVTQTEIDLSKPFIPEEDILSSRNLPMQPGDKPQLLTASDRKKLDRNLSDNIFKALDGKGSVNEGEGLMLYRDKDGNPRYVGSHMTDEQLQAIMSVDPKTLPKGLRGLIQNLNEAMKNESGQLFNGVYFKNIERQGNVRKSFRLFTPTSWQITKAGNIAVTSFDVGKFYKTLKDLSIEHPDSALLTPFKEDGDTSVQQAVERFQDSVVKYNENHANNRPGATGLAEDVNLATARRNAINGFFGIAKSDVNPMATHNNFYRAFRLDGLYELEGSNGSPFTIPYTEKGERLQEMNFQPAENKGVDNNESNDNLKNNEINKSSEDETLRTQGDSNESAQNDSRGDGRSDVRPPTEKWEQELHDQITAIHDRFDDVKTSYPVEKLIASKKEIDSRSQENYVYNDGIGNVIKITKQGIFGGTPYLNDKGEISLRGGTPNEYLDRIKLNNKVFGDDIKFLGYTHDPKTGYIAAVTSQPFIKGTSPSKSEISSFFEDNGFKMVGIGTTFYDSSKNLLAFDAHEGNFKKTPEGKIIPIDVILIHPDGDLKRQLENNSSGAGIFQPADAAGANSPKGIEKAKKLWEEKGIESPFFKKWFSGSKTVDQDGTPIVLHHGTTHDFNEFNNEAASIESDFGKGFYFTNTPDDVKTNYAGVGPDLTNRIERLAEQIESNEEIPMEEARKKAEEKLKGKHDSRVIDAYVKMKNPVILGGKNETYFDFNYNEDTGEESGSGIDLLNAIREVAHNFDDVKVDDLVGKAAEKMMDGVGAKELIQSLKEDESLAYAIDSNGDLAGNELLRQAFEAAGYDGIIDYSVNQKFGSERASGKSMEGMNEDTVHYIAFKPEQIKSVKNAGTFDSKNPDIRFQPRGVPVEGIKASNQSNNSKVAIPSVSFNNNDDERRKKENAYPEKTKDENPRKGLFNNTGSLSPKKSLKLDSGDRSKSSESRDGRLSKIKVEPKKSVLNLPPP